MLEPRAPRRCPLATATTPRAGGIRGSSDGLAEIGSSEIGLAEIGSSEIGSSEIGLAEIGIAEIGSSEIGLAEIGSSENGLAEIGSSEVGSSEVGIAEIGSSHRPERHQPFPDTRSADEGHHRIGQVHELDTVAGIDLDGFGRDRQATGTRGRGLRDRHFADGDDRALAHIPIVPP